jgi:hypothetical protein
MSIDLLFLHLISEDTTSQQQACIRIQFHIASMLYKPLSQYQHLLNSKLQPYFKNIPYAVKALLTPKIPITTNALTKHRRRECVRSKLSPRSCRLTIAMIPLVTANMHPYTLSSISSSPFLRPAILKLSAATPAPSGCDTPPSSADHIIAFQRELMARYSGRASAKPSVMLWMKRARKMDKPRVGLAWLVA